MTTLRSIEITRIDMMLYELRTQWITAKPSDKMFVMARIDYWLDQRLALM